MVARRAHHPYFDDGLKNWIFKSAHKNYWRVAAWMDIEDLIQEGYMCYAVCQQRYGKTAKNSNHFMSLVKVTYLNQITDIANRRTRQLDMPISDVCEADGQVDLMEALAGVEDGDSEFEALMARAPKELRALLIAMASDGGAAQLRKGSRRRDGTRITTNERFCKLIGVDTFDIQSALRELLA